jgi:hypothetical protein
MKRNVIALALKGMDNKELVANLIDMRPDYWLVERLIDGVTIPTREEVTEYLTKYEGNKVVVDDIIHTTDFNLENLRVEYQTIGKRYAKTEQNHVLTNAEKCAIESAYTKSAEFPHEFSYWYSTSRSISTDEFNS